MTKDEQNAEEQQQEQTDEVSDEELDLENTPDEDEEGNERNWKHEALKEKAIRQRREKKLQETQQQSQQQEKTEKKQEKKEDKGEDDFEEMVKISKSVQDLADNELEELKSLSEELGVPQKQLITSKAWKSRLNEMRNEQKEENQVPDSSQRSARKPSKSWAEMTKNERRAHFGQQVENTRKSKNLE